MDWLIMPRGSLEKMVDRVVVTLQLFQTRSYVTVRMLQARLAVSRSTSARYIEALSLRYPVVALNEESKGYHEEIRYALKKL